MDKKFRDWVVARIEKTSGEDKKAFLSMLKNNPERAAAFVGMKFEVWIAQFVIETGTFFGISDLSAASEELVRHCQEYFSKELELFNPK